MKILVTAGKGGNQFVRLGWLNALKAIGHNVYGWYPEDKPAFDIFSEYEPDIFLFGTDDISRAIFKCINNRPSLKLGIWASLWGDFDSEAPELKSTQDQQQFVLQVAQKNKSVLIAPTTDEFAEQTHKTWITHKIPVIALPPAADDIADSDYTVMPNLKSEVTFIGGFWPNKQEKLMNYLPEICEKYQTKIFGNGYWPLSNHLGTIPNNLALSAYGSSKAGLNLMQYNYPFYINDRVFRIMLSGTSCVSEYTDAIKSLLGQHVSLFHNKDECLKKLDSKSDNNKRSFIINHHTYRQRVQIFLENILHGGVLLSRKDGQEQ